MVAALMGAANKMAKKASNLPAWEADAETAGVSSAKHWLILVKTDMSRGVGCIIPRPPGHDQPISPAHAKPAAVAHRQVS
jgi:hypothetical protein